VGYLTTADLAALWEERRAAALRHRREHPDDLRGIEQRQRLATQALQTFRVLADLEQQLGLVLGLPVLASAHHPASSPPDVGTQRRRDAVTIWAGFSSRPARRGERLDHGSAPLP